MRLFNRVERISLWNDLSSQGLVSGDVPSDENIESPWYVRLLIGLSGWIAALFMLGFLGAGFSFVYENNTAGMIVGCGMIFAAYLMLVNMSESDFVSQFALAISFAGQVLLVTSLDLFHWVTPRGDTVNWAVLGLIQVALAWFIPNSIHRIWSSFAAALCLSFMFPKSGYIFIQTTLIMFAVAYIWLNEFKWVKYQGKLNPIAYGLTLALLYQTSTSFYYTLVIKPLLRDKEFILQQSWLGDLLAGAIILYVVWQLLKRQNIKIPGRVANTIFIATLVIILASLEITGITIGLMIILLGYANGNRILTGLGIISLLYYTSVYYYLLHVTLLEKSQLLAGLGVVLLLASWLMHRVLVSNRAVQDAK